MYVLKSSYILHRLKNITESYIRRNNSERQVMTEALLILIKRPSFARSFIRKLVIILVLDFLKIFDKF